MASQPKNLSNTGTTIRIILHGYGGECFMGKINRVTYEFFKKNEIHIEQYAGDWEDVDWSFIPEEHQIFSPGNPWDCDDLGHESGATMDDASFITVEDMSGSEIWQSGLDPKTLKKNGVDVKIYEEINLENIEKETIIFWGSHGEKGIFFSGEITITSQFDPKKLHISCSNLDGWLLSGGVEYDGQEVDGFDGRDTSGKWSENKFYIVGGEEVYEGRLRDDDDDDDDDDEEEKQYLYSKEDASNSYKNSPQDWEKSIKIRTKNPIRVGWYSCNYGHKTTFSSLYWNGSEWQNFSNGLLKKACEKVDWWYGYNWDTSDWKNRPKDPPEVRCKKCNWLGGSNNMLPGPENLTSELACPNCKAKNKNIDWITYDPHTKMGKNNRRRYCK